LSKQTILFIAGILILFSALFFIFPLSQARDFSPDIYKDINNYFTFKPPPDWKEDEIITKMVSQVSFRSPDGKATLGILAELNGGDLNELFFQKESFIKDCQLLYPEGKFVLSRATLSGRNVVKIDFEIPRVAKQEYYFFYDKGMRFDLVYGVADPADFEKYRQVALDAFSTIQPQEQIVWPRNKQDYIRSRLIVAQYKLAKLVQVLCQIHKKPLPLRLL
jgi:hypothetical protein